MQKTTDTKLILSGDFIEIYRFSTPVKYGKSDYPIIRKKRDSHLSRERRPANLHRTRQAVNRLIHSNIKKWGCRPLFWTLTYKENLVSLDVAHEDFKRFCQRLNYSLRKRGLSAAKYLAVVEFQTRGAVHFHVVYFNLPFIHKIHAFVSRCWGHGFVFGHTVKKVRDLGAYLCKYLTKNACDQRVYGRKAFFCSKGLGKPMVLRDEIEIASVLERGFVVNHEIAYKSSIVGLVRYYQARLDFENSEKVKAPLSRG